MINGLGNTFSVDGVSLAWDHWGSLEGTPLLLCHGFSGSSHDFALHVEDLAVGRGVVTLDHRGHGASTKLGTTDGYSIDRLAADLVALIDAEVGGPVHLLGHSMGGAISIALTLARPDLVQSLVLMDTSGWSFRPTDPMMDQLMTAFLSAYDPTCGLPDLSAMPNPEDALIEAATPQAWQEIKAKQDAAFDPYAMKALGMELFGDSFPRERLARITCPASVIVGELDGPFAEQAPELAAAVNATLTVIPGAYHSPQLTHPAEWRAAVEAHLARVG